MRVAENWSDERRSSTATELCMALSVGRGENKQKLLKILVFVPSGSIVGLDSQCQGANKNGHLKTFRTRKPTVQGTRKKYVFFAKQDPGRARQNSQARAR